MSTLLKNGTVFTANGPQARTDVLVDAGVIAGIGHGLAVAGAEVLDATGHLVVPGFVDVHIHGAAGAMCEQGEPQAVERISSALASFGVTGFLATIATLPPDRLEAAVLAVAAVAGREPGARILGIHLEGPYLSPLRAGAQSVAWMRAPSIVEIDRLQKLCGGQIRLVTVAPEIEHALPFIAELRHRGVRVAAGHSNATAAEMRRAVEAGVTHVTHLFNAMRGLHHREPGVVGAALADDGLSVELICDGQHVEPAALEIAWRCKPRGRVVLVSDAVAALGMPEGDCSLFGVACVIEGGAVRLRDGGNLAGSCCALDRAVRNVSRWMPRTALADVIAAASTTPAGLIGPSGAGEIAVGGCADLTVLDADLEVAATICRSVPVWRRRQVK